MARTKPPVKPLLAVKFEFVNSLDALVQESVNLISAIEFALDHGDLSPAIKDSLQERLTKFRAALLTEESDTEARD